VREIFEKFDLDAQIARLDASNLLYLVLGLRIWTPIARDRAPRIELTANHAICRVESFRIVGPCTMHARFGNEAEQTVDLDDSGRRAKRPLRDIGLFEQVRADPEVRTILWPDGTDFDPSTLRDRTDQLPATKAYFGQGGISPAQGARVPKATSCKLYGQMIGVDEALHL
jgi:Protein of unknown function (DUF2442)